MLPSRTLRVHVNQQKVIDLSQNQLGWKAGGTSLTNNGIGETSSGLAMRVVLNWGVSIFRETYIAIPFLRGVRILNLFKTSWSLLKLYLNDKANLTVVFLLRGWVNCSCLALHLPYFKFPLAVLPPGFPQRRVLWACACFKLCLSPRDVICHGPLCLLAMGQKRWHPMPPPPQTHPCGSWQCSLGQHGLWQWYLSRQNLC